jgi:CO/xanthine dehydrogenase FAD-binding subunit
MEYHRAQSLDEALSLLKEAVPLAGGTNLTPRRRALPSIVDLQDIGLDTLEVTEMGLVAGACVTLQSLAELADVVLAVLARTARLEAGWNLRNVATLAGSLMTADGRSPLVTALLAAGANVELQPGGENIGLDELLARREAQGLNRLITTVTVPRPRRLAYEQVARSPADRPIVCAAVAEVGPDGEETQMRVALGGYGASPVLVPVADGRSTSEEFVDEIGRLASGVYADAGDAWASAEYRSEVAGILVRRLLAKGVSK